MKNKDNRQSKTIEALNQTNSQPVQRRRFLQISSTIGLGLVSGSQALAGITLASGCDVANNNDVTNLPHSPFSTEGADAFSLPQLPYAYDALEPIIDAETMTIHHTKHHQAYVNGLNKAVSDHAELDGMSLEELLSKIKQLPESAQTAVRNSGGGHANHSLFWNTMRPAQDNNLPGGDLAARIESTFGSFENFQEKFNQNALTQFGSGWSWLVVHNEQLELMKSANQDSPIMEGKRPVLGIDVWEHAYYLKYQNRRADYVQAWWGLVNWDQVAKNLLV